MSKVILNDTTMTDIANAIRGKTGTTKQYLPSEMANAITSIPGSNLVMKRASITLASGATVLDLSPWITDDNINDWFIIGGFGYWGTEELDNRYIAPKIIGPLFRDFTPTQTEQSSQVGWVGMGFGHMSSDTSPYNENHADLQWEYEGGYGQETRMPIWDPSTKTLTVTNTNFLSKKQMFLIYREV